MKNTLSILKITLLLFLSQTLINITLAENTVVEMKTRKGSITIELADEKAPATVKNFLSYVKDGFYDGTIFHRVIPNFMIQGGGFTADMEQKATREPIQNEANNGLKNDVGTIAMARTSAPHSATAQFFINVKDNDFLNFTSESSNGWGYAVFGRITKGLDVVKQIVEVPTTRNGPHSDVPADAIIIEKVTIVE